MGQKRTLILLLTTLFCSGINLFSGLSLPLNPTLTHAFSLAQQPQSTPTPSPSGPSPDTYLQFYGSLAGAIATILAALIAGGFLFYQIRKNAQLERENKQKQSQLDTALQRQQRQADLEKMHFSEKLSARREEREQERQQRDAARAAMVAAQTPAQREQALRETICADPEITHLQILDMSQPLEITKIYVRLRLHEETQLRYEVESRLRAGEERHDPNALLKAGRAFLEERSSTAMTPEDALQKHHRSVVLGDPGAGKSTLLKYLTLKSINQQLPNLPTLPIHVALGEFVSTGKQDLIEFVAARWDERYGFPKDAARAYIVEHLTAGSALLLLDALDETVVGESEEIAAESYRQVLAAINHVATRYHKAPIIVTARKAGYYRRPRLSGFTELDILDFRLEEMQQFIDNWFANYTVRRRYATADGLKTKLEQNSRIQALAANPLLLSLIVMVYEVQHDLPDNRAELYKQCVDTLLFKWDTSRDIHRLREFKPEHKRQLLMEVAWHFHRQGKRYFPEGELLSVIAAFLPTIQYSPSESKHILSEIEDENGLLKEQAHGWHGFLHLTLQEYFAALYMSENNKQDEVLSYCGDPWWEEVFSLYAGSIFDASPLLQKLLKLEHHYWPWQDIFHTPLLWAGRCLAAKPRIKQPELRDKVITSLFDLLRRTPYSLTRGQVIITLADIHDDEVKRRLLTILKNKQDDTAIRQDAVRVLGMLGDRSIAPDLLTILKDKHDEANVRWTIIWILRDLGERSVIPDLLAILQDKQDDDGVREDVPDALVKLEKPDIGSDLLTILKDKQDAARVRGYAARALGALGNHSVIPDLLTILKDKQDAAMVREDIPITLGKLGDHSVISDLLAILKDKQDNPDVRNHIATALGAFGDHNVIPDLLAILHDKQDNAGVRGYTAETLGELGDHNSTPDLVTILYDKQDATNVREAASYTLGELGDHSAVPDLVTLFNEEQEQASVRWYIIGALGKLGESKALIPYLPRLIPSFDELSEYQKTELSATLKELVRDLPIIRILAKLLKSRDSDVVDSIHDILWTISQEAKVRILMIDWKRIKLVKVKKL